MDRKYGNISLCDRCNEVKQSWDKDNNYHRYCKKCEIETKREIKSPAKDGLIPIKTIKGVVKQHPPKHDYHGGTEPSLKPIIDDMRKSKQGIGPEWMFDNKDEDDIFGLITLEDLLEDHKIIFNMGQRKLLEYLLNTPTCRNGDFHYCPNCDLGIMGINEYRLKEMLKQLEEKHGTTIE